VRGSSIEVHDYRPTGSADEWDEAYERLRRIMETAAQLDTEGASLE
jgi:sugar phosphate isomerase/epimerase